MANLGYLLVCIFGNVLAPVLIAVHTFNNLDLDNDHLAAQNKQNEGYESD